MSLPSAGAKIQWPNIIPIAEMISAKTPHHAVEHYLAKARTPLEILPKLTMTLSTPR